MLKPMTAETRAKGQATRKARFEAGKAAYPARLGDLWADAEATKRGLRLPQAWKAPTAYALSSWSRRLNIEEGPTRYGFKTWAEYIGKNPSWSLRQMVGVMLEP